MGSSYLSGGKPARASRENPGQGTAELDPHHKVAKAVSQPAESGRIEAPQVHRDEDYRLMEPWEQLPL
jgi:hypothetical protein